MRKAITIINFSCGFINMYVIVNLCVIASFISFRATSVLSDLSDLSDSSDLIVLIIVMDHIIDANVNVIPFIFLLLHDNIVDRY